MKIDELDEFQGLTPDMVRRWLSATGQQEKECPNYQVCVHLGAHTHHGIAPMDFSVAEDWSGHWQRVNLLSVALWYIAAKQGNSMQSLLREINPRLRKGMPSEAALAAHGENGDWVVFRNVLHAVRFVWTICDAVQMVSGFDVFRSDNAEDAAMIAECSFWPCDEHGNKVRWPTDAQGNML